MDACTHQPIPSLEPAPPTPASAPAPPAATPQEATGDSESDNPVSAAPTVRPSVAAAGYAEDDAESCSGADGGGNSGLPTASVDDDASGRGGDDDVAVEGDESEVDSRMCAPWWRRMVQDAADGAGGGCARPQAVAAEGGAAAVVAGAGHTAESNRLFWEACIAHGY